MTGEYPYTGQTVTGSLYSTVMEWPTARAHYARLFYAAKRAGQTQESIAQRAGLRQNTISKLLGMEKGLGPQIETFTKAIEGLGLKPSEFFQQLEQSQTDADFTGEAKSDTVSASHGSPKPKKAADHARPVSDSAAVAALIAQGLVELGSRIHRATAGARPEALPSDREAIADSHPAQPRVRRRHARRR